MFRTLLFAAAAALPLAAVVNIAPVDIGTHPGVSGHIAASATTKRGNTEKDDYKIDAKLLYDEARSYVSWGALSYNYGEASGVPNEEKAYVHLRHIRQMAHPDWCGELFFQTQNDKFRSIQNRSLGGGGVRWRFFDSKEWGKGYAGAGAFYEYVSYANGGIDPTEHHVRANGYLAYTKAFSESSRISYIGYYQPVADASGDFIVSQTLELSLQIYGQLSLSFKCDYDYDAVPPEGVKKEDISQTTSLVWSF